MRPASTSWVRATAGSARLHMPRALSISRQALEQAISGSHFIRVLKAHLIPIA